MTMFHDLAGLAQSDLAMLREAPFWLMVLLCALWFLPMLLCLRLDRKSLFQPLAQSHNTIHTAFWLAVMLTLPCVGSVLYGLGSVLPCCIWRKKTGGHGEIPFSFHLRRRQLASLMTAFLLPVLLWFWQLHLPADTAVCRFLQGFDWTFEIPFLCCVWLILTDWLRSVQRPALYLRFSPERATPVHTTEFYGVPYAREEGTRITAPAVLREESLRARRAADYIFRYHVYSQALIGNKENIRIKAETHRCQVLGIRGAWLGNAPDFMEMRYIGRGITRCRVCIWEET
ncbi:MAG: hypothetical protein II916_03055, partial [Oscillospiraceae bacterium]|nr:hypothetical protein [Oscillospiraceae bacterium]